MNLATINDYLKVGVTMDKVRIGIIGIGNIGTAHANTLFGGKVEGA